jgi:hypothetical protein
MCVDDVANGICQAIWRGCRRFCRRWRQGLTLVDFSAQLEPCLSQENTLHTLKPTNTPLTRATQPLRARPFPYKALKLS